MSVSFATSGGVYGIRIDKETSRGWVGTQEGKEQLEALGFKNVRVTPQSAMRQLTPQEIAAEEADAKESARREAIRLNSVPDNDPSNLWGEIVKDGKTIASIYKSGAAVTSYYIPMNSNSPAERAKEIMAHFGGTVNIPRQSRGL